LIYFYPSQTKQHGVIGVEMGIINIAATSFAKFWQRGTHDRIEKLKGWHNSGTPRSA
jgi:hypothetical protein